jgi:hypothetical protein
MLSLVVPAPVSASDGSANSPAPTCNHDAEAGKSAMRATIDPATGRLSQTPTPGSVTIGSNVAAGAPPEVRELPNGASILNTRALLHTMTATVNPDGGLPKTDCAPARQP